MKYWLFLGISVLAEVVATSSLKASEGFSKPLPSIAVVIGYTVAFYFLSLTLKSIPLGVAYAVWAGAGVVLVSLVGLLFYEQKLDPAAAIGMGLIVTGVVVLNVFSRVSAH